MKLCKVSNHQGFTLSEMLIGVSIGAVALATTIAASVGLQKSLNAVDNYFTAHAQQIRIVDYLARDVRRGLSVVSSVDKHTVTVNIPRYIIQAGDADATGSNVGTPRAPSTSAPRTCSLLAAARPRCSRTSAS